MWKPGFAPSALAWMLALAALGVVGAGALGGVSPVLDTPNHALRLVALGSVALAGVLAALRHAKPAAVGAIAAVWAGFAGAPMRPLPSQADDAHVRVLFQNVWFENPSGAALIAAIAAADPDIVALVEAGGPAGSAVGPALRARYPYQLSGFVHGEVMLALSKRPLTALPAANREAKVWWVEAETAAGPLTIGVTHLHRPWPFQPRSRLPGALAEVAAETRARTGPLLLVGDFNATGASAALKQFERTSGLVRAEGWAGTWPSALPGVLRSGIDHGFAKGARLVSRAVIAPVGSDHRGVIIGVELNPAGGPAASTRPFPPPPHAPS